MIQHFPSQNFVLKKMGDIFNIYENNIINVKVAKVIGYSICQKTNTSTSWGINYKICCLLWTTIRLIFLRCFQLWSITLGAIGKAYFLFIGKYLILSYQPWG